MKYETPERLFTSFRRFFTGTFISRISGFFREVAMAATFGTSPAVAAFWMAFRFSYLFRRIFGEGGLHVAFVPHFEALRKKDPKEAAAFFSGLTFGLSALMLGLALIGEIILASILLFASLSESSESVIKLTMVLLPSFLFVSLYALNASLLQCEGKYFLSSVAPALFNLIWVGAVFILPKSQERALEILAMILVAAMAVQWLLTWLPAGKILHTNLQAEKRPLPWRTYLSLLRPFSLALIGVAAVQINSALDTLFARFADPEGPAILWYAIRIEQLPLALFGIGVSAAFFPPISRAATESESGHYLYLINLATKKAISLMLPLTFALFSLGLVGVTFVYGRGAFTDKAIFETTTAMWAYGIGLLPSTLVFIFASAFYALKEYRIPTLLSVSSMVLNAALNALFVFGCHMGAISIALATSIAALFNALFLALYLAHRIGSFSSNLTKVSLKSLIAGAGAALATLFISQLLFQGAELRLLAGLASPLSKGLFSQFFELATLGICFFGSFFLLSLLVRNKELFELLIPTKQKADLPSQT